MKLENRDFVLVIDKSGSMSENDTVSGKTRWEEAQETTLAVARKLASLDPDGITLYVFAGLFKKYENCSPDRVKQIFAENDPSGGTTLGPVLADVFADYNKRKAAGQTKQNGEMLIVVTDGQPSDESAVASEIVKFGNALANADEEYGISFFQIGKDKKASDFLKKLDDDLAAQGAKHDIVDTKTMDELENMTLTEALMAALDD